MSSYISEKLRQEVYERARGFCEYCRLHERYSGAKHEVDHIVAEKHSGLTIESNLCLSCLLCNRNKGSDIVSIDSLSAQTYPNNIVPLYHPRLHLWTEHFQIIEGLIEPITAEGRVTVALLRLNESTRLGLRIRLYKLGRYP